MESEQQAKLREEHQRRQFLRAFLALLLIKPFPFLHRFVPRRGQDILEHWTFRMLWTVVVSRGRRVLADIPSTVKVPNSFEPLVDVQRQYRLSEDQIRSFYENGYLGPLKAMEPEEAAARLEEIDAARNEPSRIYGFPTERDRHLEIPQVLAVCRLPSIIERVAQVMGPDLQTWRTQLLFKPPGSPETAWHQVTTFILSGKSLRPLMIPKDINDLFNLTVWVAFEDVDEENGCLQYVRGSHLEPMNTITLGTGQKFGKSIDFRLDYDADPSRIVDMRLKAGEFVMFHERTIHAERKMTHPTRSRYGMNIRICRPDVRCYHKINVQRSVTFKDPFNLEKWGVVQLRGEDRFGYNRHADLSHERTNGKLAG